MRLIDADVLKEIIGECPENWTDSPEEIAEFNMWHRVMDDIDSTPTVGEWISVKDRLPKSGDICLILTPTGKMRVAEAFLPNPLEKSSKECWWTMCGAGKFASVTHWMPLSEPPKEVTGDA